MPAAADGDERRSNVSGDDRGRDRVRIDDKDRPTPDVPPSLP